MSSRTTLRFVDPEEAFKSVKPGETFSSYFAHKYVKGLISADYSTILDLLKKERSTNTLLNDEMTQAEAVYEKSVKTELPKECHIAIIAYTSNSNLYKDFNERCRKMDSDKSWEKFPYKSLYALLARSIHDIDNVPPVTTEIYYRGMKQKVRSLKMGQHIFSKQFMSCTPKKAVADNFLGPKGTLLIYQGSPRAACGIKNLSMFPEEEELLVFPWNVFEVTNIVPGKQDEVYLKTVESFEMDLPYCGNYKSKGVAVSNN
ncbi:NAD(P)(+)--arginine ADP-ribosyltransferase 2-like [Zophobas morio]|uniref:NAD(P)(+)--arginine ADP-ribosyltransferase 2-like n=1 Tax=Zophobas morio TaxID=2755281 RepID=UPI003083C8C0